MHPMDLIYVGKILGTHGVKGSVKVSSLTDFEQRFEELDRVYLISDRDNLTPESESPIVANIESSFSHKGLKVVKFEQWDDINEVESFKHWFVSIPRNERPPLGENEFYLDEITGLSVKTTQGEHLGKVTSVVQTGSNDVYEVMNENSDKPVLIPALLDVIVEIDLQCGNMIVDPPEGLLGEEE